MQNLITAYLLCFPEKSREYAESYLADLEQYKFIIYSTPTNASFPRKRESIVVDSRLRGNEANSEDEIYAFVIYRIVGGDEAEIIDIGIIPEKRKQGFGAKILNEMEFELKKHKVKKIHLEFREDNFPAEKLYRKLGYIKAGERKGYYKTAGSQAKNAILMTKFI